MLYWGFFTIGFMFGAILSFVTFASKDNEDEAGNIQLENQSVNMDNKGDFGPVRASEKAFNRYLSVLPPSVFKFKPSGKSDHLIQTRRQSI